MSPEPFTAEQTVEDADGQLYKMVITGEAEITRGPLGLFLDLAEHMRGKGIEVPAAVAAVLELEQRPTREAWEELNQRWQAVYRSWHEAATVVSQVAHVVAGYNPIMEGPAAAIGAMARIVDILTDSDLGPKVQNLPKE